MGSSRAARSVVAIALFVPAAACGTLLGLDDFGYPPIDGGPADGPADQAAHDTSSATSDAADAGPAPTHLVVMGGNTKFGNTTAAVWVGTLLPDGSVGAWVAGEPLTQPVSFSVGLASPTGVFSAGGSASSGEFLNEVYGAADNGGALASWVMVRPLLSQLFRHSGASTAGFFYLVGGDTYATDAAPTGQIGAVEYAAEGSDGHLGAFSLTTPLPAPRNQHASAASRGFVFATGGLLVGEDSSMSINGDVLSAQQDPDAGTLGQWTTQSDVFPARYRHGAVTFNGNLLVVGGLSASGAFLSDVQIASIAPNGSVGNFYPTVSFPAPGRMDFGCIVVGSTLYVLGGDPGVPNGTLYDDDVWYAKLDDQGNISKWKQGLSLPTGLGYFAVAAY